MADRLGRYVVLKHLASGGMADVLLARTDGIEGFERHVVLKRIKSEHAKDQRFIDMFLDEARLAATLHHSNIVQVHDIGEASGEYFFAMEYLHGEDLRSMLSTLAKTKTNMPLQHVIAIVSSAAAGLHYAHERRGQDKKPLNIVHRDVSPSNILVGYDGSVKVVDFGIAKASQRQVETRSGSLKGKVSYMSPEQCKSLPADRRSDVYALGVVLYELATSTRLFKSDSDYLVMDAICTGKIPLPRVRRPDLPNELSTIIMTALATDPARRYQTAEELRVALDTFAARQGLSANAAAIATYLTKIFGERPEPWLDLAESDVQPSPQGETVANRELRGRSWTDLPLPAPDQTKIGTGSGVRNARTPSESKPATISASRLSKVAIESSRSQRPDDRTSTRMAWEHEGSLPPAPAARVAPGKIAMIAVPVLLLVGLGIWKLASGGGGETEKVAAAVPTVAPDPSAPAPGRDRTVEPAARPSPQPAAVATDPAATQVAAPTAIVTPQPTKVEVAKAEAAAKAEVAKADAAKKELAKVELAKSEAAKAELAKAELAKADAAKKELAKAEAAKKELAKVEAAKVTTATKAGTKSEPGKGVANAGTKTEPTKAGATEPAKVAAVVPPAVATPVPLPPPPTVEPQLAHLSGASVEGVASQHRKALSKCEGTDELHGDVTVKFEINAAGRVVKSQVASTIKNPKVSGCILRVIQGWQFPKPPATGAEGTYSMSYQ